MKDIHYIDILKKSLHITWNNRYLWWFGFFVALGSGGGLNFNFNFGNGNWGKESRLGAEKAVSFFANQWQLLLAVFILIVILGIILFILRLRGTAALVKSVERAEKEKENNFKLGWKEGKKYFWRLFWVNILLGISFLIAIAVLFIPIALLFHLKAYITAALALITAIIIIIPLAIIYAFLKEYSNLYIILSNLGVQSALDNAYYLFRHNILPGIILALIFIPVKIALIFIILFILLSIFAVFFVIGFILYAIFHAAGTIIAISLGILAFLTVILLLASIFEVFYQTAWILFFKEIASENIKKPAEETVEILKEKIPSPGEA